MYISGIKNSDQTVRPNNRTVSFHMFPPVVVRGWGFDGGDNSYGRDRIDSSASAIKAPKKGRLTAALVRSVNRPGVYRNQHGLQLRVHESRKRKCISKHWVWRGTVNGTRRDVGLGAFPYVPLADARQQAYEHRKIARAGGDPVGLKRKPDVPTFADAVETVIGIHREGWKDAGKSEKQWRASLRDYAMKRLGHRRVDQITTADVMAVLIPHWHTKNETMRRVRQRIGAVMKWAVAQIYRDDNPAGDVISAALPKTVTCPRCWTGRSVA